MPTEKEIINKYEDIHDSLTEDYYKKKLMAKVEFVFYHGQNWDDMETELIAEGYRELQKPARDVLKELDDLRLKITELEKK